MKVIQQVKKFLKFIETQFSLPSLREHTTGPYCGLDASIPNSSTLFS